MTIHNDDFALPAPPDTPRVVSASAVSAREEALERALRPRELDEYVGQAKAREQLEIFIGAARKRGEALDHVLLFGPPGLGKTTLSHIIAHELGVNLRQTSGPVLEKPKDLAALLTNLERNDVLFIDEIHRLSPVVEEILYPALEDYQIDIMIGEGPAARSIKLSGNSRSMWSMPAPTSARPWCHAWTCWACTVRRETCRRSVSAECSAKGAARASTPMAKPPAPTPPSRPARCSASAGARAPPRAAAAARRSSRRPAIRATSWVRSAPAAPVAKILAAPMRMAVSSCRLSTASRIG